MITETKWLRFEPQPQPSGRKTSIWKVVAREGGETLGKVAWWGPWRQYVFFPEHEALLLFNRTCLRDLADFCDIATTMYREAIKAK
jgi:hypothetical protein